MRAGKTTLINHILSQGHGRRVAVIENEFGEIGIDNDLIVGKESVDGASEITILENGCICCTVRDDLVKALDTLCTRGGFDHVLVETTGVPSESHLCPQCRSWCLESTQILSLLPLLRVGRHKDALRTGTVRCAWPCTHV